MSRKVNKKMAVGNNAYEHLAELIRNRDFEGAELEYRKAAGSANVPDSIISAMAHIFSGKMGIRLFGCRQPNNLFIGKHTYGFPAVRSWGEGCCVFIGAFCSIADNVTIMTGGNHKTNWVSTFPFFQEKWPNSKTASGFNETKGDVTIGSDVWLARGCTIMSGVTVGTGSVVAAEALVTKDVPPYAIVGGNPAKIIRYRFEKDHIDRLLATQWWCWPDEVIDRALPWMQGEDIESFLIFAETQAAAIGVPPPSPS